MAVGAKVGSLGRVTLFFAVLATTLALFPSAASATPLLLWEVPEDGSAEPGPGAGQLSSPRAIAVSPVTGHVFVADQGNRRIDEFTAWGEFVMAFGWDVNAEHPEEKLQTCTPTTGCQAGSSGSSAGQFREFWGIQGLVVDGSGDIFAVDTENHRVQKFDSEGHFLLMFGGEVDKTTKADICTASSGDVCGAGVIGTGNGEFSDWNGKDFEGFIGEQRVSSGLLAVGPGDAIYVGDLARIQIFDSEGVYQSQIALPKEGEVKFGRPEGEGHTGSLAVDDFGNVYFTFPLISSSGSLIYPGIFKHTPGGSWSLFSEDRDAGPLATDEAGNLYAADQPIASNGNRGPMRIIEFDPAGQRLLPSDAEEEANKEEYETDGAKFDFFGDKRLVLGPRSVVNFEIPSLATSGKACGISGEGLYASYVGGFSYPALTAYGNPPNPAICPPPVRPPTIASQYATSVDGHEATVRAKVNSHFWESTTYYVEYGTEPCSLGGCSAHPAPGVELGSKSNAAVTTPGIFLSGLEAGTTYHYRFVAKTVFDSGEAEVKGVGGEVGKDGQEGTFTTPEPTLPPSEACENQAFRVGASATLPDCRAYEMVSPVEKEGGDIVTLVNATGYPARLDQSSTSGDKLTYSTFRPFGEALSAPTSSQYIASRVEGTGWSSEAISPPFGRSLMASGANVDRDFLAFSPDLCQGWLRLLYEAEPVLDPAAVEDMPNLYRRDNCGGGYEALTTLAPPHQNPHSVRLELEGTSADGQTALYTLNDNLPGTEAPAINGKANQLAQLYIREADGTTRFACILPGGGPAPKECAAGNAQAAGLTGRNPQLTGAISADGTKVFFTTGGSLFVRSNPLQPESARLHGAATGTGNLIGPAAGTGNTNEGAKTVSEVQTTSGAFAVGQAITGPGIPAETTIAEIKTGLLKLSKAATATANGVKLTGAASATVTNVIAKTGAFAAGQSITGPGIPAEATITKVEEPKAGVFTLALSASASQSGTAVALEASSKCTEAEKACTVLIAAGGQFWAAATDGSRAIYEAGGALLEYETATGATSTIAPSGTLGVLGQSEDASRVYFASSASLAAGATAGQPNLYFHEAGTPPRFIATLEPAAGNIVGAIRSRPIFRASRVTADGLHAAFVARASLTGYDNTDAETGEADGEAFAYDAGADGGEGRLVCVSCDPSGALPTGRTMKGKPWEGARVAAWIPTWETNLYSSNVLAEDGSRLFFNSFVPLVARDTNGREDVYEWRSAQGREECEAQGAERYVTSASGCLSLISSGESVLDSEFLDASSDGRDVFFTTVASLLPQDPGLIDIYDAREGGGLPPPPSTPPSCEGEACQGTPEPPNDPTPSSESFEGAGNVREEAPAAKKPQSCAKGKVRRHGKCVARHKAKKRHAKHNRRAGR